MKKLFRMAYILTLTLILALALAAPACAAPETGGEEAAVTETQEENTSNWKGIASAIAMGVATAKSTESIARQPEADGKIRTSLMLGLVFIETAIIYALLVVILIIFVL